MIRHELVPNLVGCEKGRVMRRTALTLGATVVLLCATVFGQNKEDAAKPQEPLTGRSLDLVIRRLNDPDSKVRKAAAESFENSTGQYAEFNMDYPRPEHAKKRREFQDLARPYLTPLIALLISRDDDVVTAASVALGVVGHEARQASPKLTQVFLDPTRSPDARGFAFWGLRFVLPETEPVGPTVLKLLNSSERRAIEMAVSRTEEGDGGKQKQIVRIPPEPFEFDAGSLLCSGHTLVEVPYVLQVARGKYSSELRQMALSALGSFETDAKSAIPELWKLVHDADPLIRQAAAKALMKMTADPKLVGELETAFNLNADARGSLELEAMRYFEEGLERSDQEMLAKVRLKIMPYMVTCDNGFFRRQAIRKLTRLGPVAKPALPELRKALSASDEETRQLAAEAIREIEASTR
jgi:HEAT repeat protein